jgi:hypothetical protein
MTPRLAVQILLMHPEIARISTRALEAVRILSHPPLQLFLSDLVRSELEELFGYK